MMDMISMFLISLIAGLLSSMNIWAVKCSHVKSHINDVYMILLMSSWMSLLTYVYYFKHMQNMTIGIMISIILILMTIYCIRKQFLVDDKQFLKGMIPHHSMAIQMAQHIKTKTTDENIKALANNIIITQTNEIELMENILRSK